MPITARHHKEKRFAPLIILGACLVIFGAAYIVLYQKTVQRAHQTAAFKDELVALKTSNAELKERLYRMLDLKDQAVFAGRMGLVKDAAPRYFGARQ